MKSWNSAKPYLGMARFTGVDYRHCVLDAASWQKELSAHGLGPAQRTVEVASDAVLCLTEHDTLLGRRRGRGPATFVSTTLPAKPTPVRIKAGRVRGSVNLSGERFAVSAETARQAAELIALGSFRQRGQAPLPPLDHPFTSPYSNLESAGLAWFLRPDELVLVWCTTSHRVNLPSRLAAKAVARGRLLITNQRCGLLSISDFGDVDFRTLSSPPQLAAGKLVVGSSRIKVPDFVSQLSTLWQLREEERTGAFIEAARRALPALPTRTMLLPGQPPSLALRQHIAVEELFRLAERGLSLPSRQEALRQSLQRSVYLSPFDTTLQALLGDADESSKPQLETVRDLLSLPRSPSPARVEPPETTSVSAQTTRVLSGLEQSSRRGNMLERLQKLVARPSGPDAALVRQYCERVTSRSSPLTRAVDRAATLLAMGHVESYVSYGSNDVGIRAFDGTTPYVLIGGQHLRTDSRYGMTEVELTFAVASELSHVRLEHSRIHPDDIRRGVQHWGRRATEVVLASIPLASGLKLGGRVGIATATLGLPKVTKTLRAAVSVQRLGRKQPSPASEITAANERLLPSQRELQLVADRFGLECCGDVFAAVSAMLRMRSDYVRVAEDWTSNDLLAAIARQQTGNQAAFEDLLVRIGCLIRFFLFGGPPLPDEA